MNPVPAVEPHRGSIRLDGPPGRAAAGDLVAFAEALVREASPQAEVTSATVQLLDSAASGRISGAAHCLVPQGAPVWRVGIAGETGAPLAEVTLTLSPALPQASPVVSIEPVARPRPRPRPEDRRARIALAAQEVFADKGYTAATMREIAAAADMHVPTMYQYVRSKEEILELVYAWTIDRAVAGMEDVLSARGPALDRMDAIVRRLHDVNAELRRGTLVMNRETRSLSREARDRVLGHYAVMVRRIGEAVADGQAEGVFRPMDPQLAAVFIDALADVWVLRPFAVGQADPETYAADLVAFVRGALTGNAAKNPGPPVGTESIRRE